MNAEEFEKLKQIEAMGNDPEPVIRRKKTKAEEASEVQRIDPGEKKSIWNDNRVIAGIFAVVLIIGIAAFLITSKTANQLSAEEKAEAQMAIEKDNEGRESLTGSQKKAREYAESMVKATSYSRAGIIEKLVKNGYSQRDAEVAVDGMGLDFMEEAVKAANTSLKYMPYSESLLKDQMIYEKFTEEEAEYAVKNCGADWDEQAVFMTRYLRNAKEYTEEEMIKEVTSYGFTEAQVREALKEVDLSVKPMTDSLKKENRE